MIPASLSAVLARIGAIQSRFGGSAEAAGGAAGDTSTFANVLNQVSGAAGGSASNVAAELSKLPQSERDLIINQARREGIDPALALAVVLQESGGNPNAVSPAGALGLMQLMPGTVQELGVSKPFDPTQNLAGGLDYLHQKLTEFGSVPLGLAAYNAGSGAVSTWGGVPPYPETQSYVATIMHARDEIARQLANGTPAGSTGGAGTAAPAAASNSAGAKPAGSAPGRDDGSPRGLAPSPGGDHAASADGSSAASTVGTAVVSASVARTRAEGQGAFSIGAATASGSVSRERADGQTVVSAAVGSAAAVSARVDASGIIAGGKDADRRGAADAVSSAGLGGVPGGNSAQAQVGGGAYQGIGQGMSQGPQGGGASGTPSSGGDAQAANAGSQARGADGPPVGAPGGTSVSHVTIRSGGDLPVTVTLTDRSDAVSARVVTPTTDMAQTLRDHAGTLRAALAAHQVQLSDLAVRPASSDRSSNGQPQDGFHRSPRPAQIFQMTTPDSEEDTHELASV